MGNSIADANRERRNHKATHSDFPVGSRVRVVCVCQDMTFFFPETEPLTGVVVENKNQYLGIKVKWDTPRIYEGGYAQESFSFDPHDMVLISPSKTFLDKFTDMLSYL